MLLVSFSLARREPTCQLHPHFKYTLINSQSPVLCEVGRIVGSHKSNTFDPRPDTFMDKMFFKLRNLYLRDKKENACHNSKYNKNWK